MSDKILADALAHISATSEMPGDWWAFDEDRTSLGLDHRFRDGAKFWLDLNRNGTITVCWKPPGSDKMQTVKFVADGQAER